MRGAPQRAGKSGRNKNWGKKHRDRWRQVEIAFRCQRSIGLRPANQQLREPSRRSGLGWESVLLNVFPKLGPLTSPSETWGSGTGGLVLEFRPPSNASTGYTGSQLLS